MMGLLTLGAGAAPAGSGSRWIGRWCGPGQASALQLVVPDRCQLHRRVEVHRSCPPGSSWWVTPATYDGSGRRGRSSSSLAMGTTSPDLFIDLDRSRPRGLRAQVEGGLRSAIRTGQLAPGRAAVESIALAADLDVTRGVVVDAYCTRRRGLPHAGAGVGTVVNDIRAVEPSTPRGAAAALRRPRRPHPRLPQRPARPEAVPAGSVSRATRAALCPCPTTSWATCPRPGFPACGRRWPTTSAGSGRGLRARPGDDLQRLSHGFGVVVGGARGPRRHRDGRRGPGYDEPRRPDPARA